MMLFESSVAPIVVGFIFIGVVYLRIVNRLIYSVGDILNDFGGISGRIFADVLEHLSHLFL